jgi:hypothetical protein
MLMRPPRYHNFASTVAAGKTVGPWHHVMSQQTFSASTSTISLYGAAPRRHGCKLEWLRPPSQTFPRRCNKSFSDPSFSLFFNYFDAIRCWGFADRPLQLDIASWAAEPSAKSWWLRVTSCLNSSRKVIVSLAILVSWKLNLERHGMWVSSESSHCPPTIIFSPIMEEA